MDNQREQLDNLLLKKGQKHQISNFEYKYIYNMSAKGYKFYNVNFKYSVIDFSYFHQAEFYDCDFTGATIKDSNFRSSKFERCNFDYVNIYNTIIPYNDILQNLPQRENVRLSFLKSLRVNAETTGEKGLIQKLILEEVDTERIHYKKAFLHNESYYASKYKGFDRFKSLLNFLDLSIRKLLWNHGYSYKRISLILLFIIFLQTLFCTFSNISLNTTLSNFIKTYSEVLAENVSIFLDIPNITNVFFKGINLYLIVLLRYFFIGLIINIFYVKNIRK